MDDIPKSAESPFSRLFDRLLARERIYHTVNLYPDLSSKYVFGAKRYNSSVDKRARLGQSEDCAHDKAAVPETYYPERRATSSGRLLLHHVSFKWVAKNRLISQKSRV